MRNINKIYNFVFGAILLWGVAYATIFANLPAIYSPHSFSVVFPVILFDEFLDDQIAALILGTLPIPILFFLWGFPLIRGQECIPKRTMILACILILLSFVGLLFSWPYGVQYQGYIHTFVMYLLNFCCWVALLKIVKNNKRKPSYSSNFLFHWILFAWLGWVAFPWLGELI